MRAGSRRPRRRASSVKKTIGKPCAGNPQARFERGFCPFTDERPFLKVKGQNLPMATPWDRAAAGYLDEWVPRFVPYHLDLVRELALHPGARVLVASAGPGSEALAVARTVGGRGKVRATDKSEEMVRLCREQVKTAGFTNVEADVADA